MVDSSFQEPVMLHFQAGVTAVSNAQEASEALVRVWPSSRGKWYHAARRACASATEGRTSPHVARRIFVQAAEESRISS
jgi:hypothetical protein